jgi:hypothetical protein
MGLDSFVFKGEAVSERLDGEHLRITTRRALSSVQYAMSHHADSLTTTPHEKF